MKIGVMIDLEENTIHLSRGDGTYWFAGKLTENFGGVRVLEGTIEILSPDQEVGGPWVGNMVPVALDTTPLQEACDLLYEMIHSSNLRELIRAQVALQIKIAQMDEVAAALGAASEDE